MVRSFAGILGVLAFVVVLVRGLIDRAVPETTIAWACGALVGYAVVGYVLASLAARTVEQSVHDRLRLTKHLSGTETGAESN